MYFVSSYGVTYAPIDRHCDIIIRPKK